jgi:chromosome segregation ATPase
VAENTLQTAQGFLQDVLAPDVRELKVKVDALSKRIDDLDKRIDGLDRRVDALEKRMNERFDAAERHMNEKFAAERAQNDANLKLILGAIARLELVSENSGLRAVMEVRERVAVLEARAA